MNKRQKKKAQATAIVMPLKVSDWMIRLANQLYLERYNRKQEVDELARNKVELLSVNNSVKLFIDGTKVKGLKKLDIHRSVENPRALINMEFICDLNTKEQSIENGSLSINREDIKQLLDLLSQLNRQQWGSVKTIVDMAFEAKFKNEKVSFDKAIDLICEDILQSK